MSSIHDLLGLLKEIDGMWSVNDCSPESITAQRYYSPRMIRLWMAVRKAISEGSMCSPDNPPFDTLEPQAPWVAELNKVATRIKARHPKSRSVSIKVVKAKLTTIMRETPEPQRYSALDMIDYQHQQWCRSADWTKDGGAFAKSLEAWLNPKARLWENEPRPVAAKPEYVDRYALEGGV